MICIVCSSTMEGQGTWRQKFQAGDSLLLILGLFFGLAGFILLFCFNFAMPVLMYFRNRVLRKTIKASETPFLQEGNEDQFDNCSPGTSEATAVCNQDASTSRALDINRSSNNSRGIRSVVSALTLSRCKKEGFDDCEPLIPNPLGITTVSQQDTSRRTHGSQDIGQSATGSFTSSDSAVAMMKGKSNKPPYIPDSIISNSESPDSAPRISKNAANNEQMLLISQQDFVRETGDHDKVLFVPTTAAEDQGKVVFMPARAADDQDKVFLIPTKEPSAKKSLSGVTGRSTVNQETDEPDIDISSTESEHLLNKSID